MDFERKLSRRNLSATLVAQIVDEIQSGRLRPETHLGAQQIADRFAVSRSPVNAALQILVETGALRHEPNKGYFVNAVAPDRALPLPAAQDELERAYLQLAEDRLEGRVPDTISAATIRSRYGLTQAGVQALVTRIIKEGWLEQRAGYGLSFTAMLNNADALVQTYRVRMALEPAALMEPGYHLDPKAAAHCRRVEEAMLAGGIATMSHEELYDRGVNFHETIVGASRNPFYLDALKRINSIRRLLAYRSTANRDRYTEQARDHLAILTLLEQGRNEEASWLLRSHIGKVIHNLQLIRPLLDKTASAF